MVDTNTERFWLIDNGKKFGVILVSSNRTLSVKEIEFIRSLTYNYISSEDFK